jgi:hypothetical protein
MAAIDPSAIEKLRRGLQGSAHAPGEEGYDEGRRTFNLNAHQEPALVVLAEAAADVVTAVRLAKDRGLEVGVLATGHGVAAPCDGGVLINTARMRGVRLRRFPGARRRDAGTRKSLLLPGGLGAPRRPQGPLRSG